MEDYTSEELAEIGRSADIHTVEESIEAQAQKKIAEAQQECIRRIDKLQSDEYANRFFQTLKDQTDAVTVYEAHVHRKVKHLKTSRDNLIAGVQKVRDDRLRECQNH